MLPEELSRVLSSLSHLSGVNENFSRLMELLEKFHNDTAFTFVKARERIEGIEDQSEQKFVATSKRPQRP